MAAVVAMVVLLMWIQVMTIMAIATATTTATNNVWMSMYRYNMSQQIIQPCINRWVILPQPCKTFMIKFKICVIVFHMFLNLVLCWRRVKKKWRRQ